MLMSPQPAGGVKETHLYLQLVVQGLPPAASLPSGSCFSLTRRGSVSENLCVVFESVPLSKNMSLSPGVQENRVFLFYGQENINEK